MEGASLVLIQHSEALSRAMDIVANNVANANTTGFKRQELQFGTLMTQFGTPNALDFPIDRATYRDNAQGPMTMTGNALDVALMGSGYFPIQTPNGTRYTRGGAFQRNASGEIVTGAGMKLLGDGDQPIVIPDDATDIQISPDGVVAVKSGGSVAMLQVGKLKIVKFASEQNLKPEGSGFYSTSETPLADTSTRVVQGMVERSNVEMVTEMTKMINISRSYEAAMHLIDLENQRQSSAITRLGKATA